MRMIGLKYQERHTSALSECNPHTLTIFSFMTNCKLNITVVSKVQKLVLGLTDLDLVNDTLIRHLASSINEMLCMSFTRSIISQEAP